MVISNGTRCSEIKYEITSAEECRIASEILGLRWGGSWTGNGQTPACSYAITSNKVYYNLSPNPGRLDIDQQESQICRRLDGKKIIQSLNPTQNWMLHS